MGKKRLLIVILIMILMVVTGTTLMYVKETSEQWYKKVEIADFGFEISYPRAYKDIVVEKSNVEQISSIITATITEVEKDTDVSMNFVKELIHAKSNLSGMTILVEGIKKEKTEKTIDEICQDYITMFKVFNDELVVYESNYEETTVDGVKAGKVKILVEGKTEDVYPGMISYLISLDDREITIAFTGTEKLFIENEKEIDKIISSIKLLELSKDSGNNKEQVNDETINAENDLTTNSGDNVSGEENEEIISGELVSGEILVSGEQE